MTLRAALISVLEEFDPGGWYQDPRIDEWVDRLATAHDEENAAASESKRIEIYTVMRIPYTFAAKNTIGNRRTTYEVEASSSLDAIRQAQARSEYPRDHNAFVWDVTGSRIA